MSSLIRWPRSKHKDNVVSVSFDHGLGDCVYFAHLIPLYLRRGYTVEVECTADKRILFEASGATVVSKGATVRHEWGYPSGGSFEGHGRFWQGSKMGSNISAPPMPHIGDIGELWHEFCDTRVDILSRLPPQATHKVGHWLSELPRPIVAFHSKGNTYQQRKSLPDDVVNDFYAHFLDQCDGTLILLDWDNRVPRISNYRVRHLDELGHCPTETLLSLLNQSDLIIGVDSGPLHAARFTETPTIGLWMPGHYPGTYSLPRREQLNVVLSDHTRQWNTYKRIPWNIYEHSGNCFSGAEIASLCRKMLAPTQYLSADKPASDVQLQQFVAWCKGNQGIALSGYSDRNRSFDTLFREMKKRFHKPIVVETGTIRAEEDWAGAGFFTYLMGAYLYHSAGQLFSVDNNATCCAFAEQWTSIFRSAVNVICSDSVTFLNSFEQQIDVLYLDSLDTTEKGHEQHTLKELQAAFPKLSNTSIVVCDDSPWCGSWSGKGRLAIPWLLQRGWQVIYGGYQVVLAKAQ